MDPSRRLVMHADLDAFYAAVEQLDDPALRGRPVLVGPPSGRGVVLTASYEARPFGVGSAMPMAWARQRCPHAVIVPPRFERYTELSRKVMDAFADFSPTVEPLSLDEAFVDMTGAAHLFGGALAMAREVKARVAEATGGLVVSVGVASTKYVAKVASDLRKPDGLVIVPHEESRAFLAPLPVKRLWGAGPVTVGRLEACGLRRIGQLAEADPEWLERRLGKMGARFARLARAEDPRPVIAWSGRKSVGCQRTLAKDIRGFDAIELYLRRSADEIGQRLRDKRLIARGVRVRLKTAGFRSMTRQITLRRPTQLGQVLSEEGVALLDRFDHSEAFRLVGMAAYDLLPERPEQLELFRQGGPRQHRLESALDDVRRRFGSQALKRGDDVLHGRGMRLAPNLDFAADDARARRRGEGPHWEPTEEERARQAGA